MAESGVASSVSSCFYRSRSRSRAHTPCHSCSLTLRITPPFSSAINSHRYLQRKPHSLFPRHPPLLLLVQSSATRTATSALDSDVPRPQVDTGEAGILLSYPLLLLLCPLPSSWTSVCLVFEFCFSAGIVASGGEESPVPAMGFPHCQVLGFRKHPLLVAAAPSDHPQCPQPLIWQSFRPPRRPLAGLFKQVRPFPSLL